MQARFKVSFSTQSAKSEQYRVVAGMICLKRCSATWSETMVACAALKQRIRWTPKSCMDRGFELRRSHPNVAAVALANKNVRTVWALLAHGREFRPNYMPPQLAA